MSRSPRAWTEDGYEHPARAVSSLIPLCWVATAVMLMLALSPATALGKVGKPHRRASAPPASRASRTAGVTHPRSHSSGPPHASGPAGHAGDSRRELLTLGAGYSAVNGSSAVRVLQRRLIRAGFSPGPIDGRYGPLTEGAVIRFQATRSLRVDGIAGPHTLAALASATPVLRMGSGYVRGGSALVRKMQHELGATGFATGPTDGRYGPRTERAVMRFQHARHLLADGIAGPQTLHRLQATTLAHRSHHRSHGVASGPRRRGHRSRSTSKRSTREPTPSKAATPGPSGLRNPADSPSIAWIILLACLLTAVLAETLRRGHRRSRDRLVTAAAPPHGGQAAEDVGHRTGARGDVSGPAPPSAGVGERAAESPAGQTEDQSEDRHDGAAALRLGRVLAEHGDRIGAEDAFRHAEERGHPAAAFELGVLLALERYRAAAKNPFRRPRQRRHPNPTVDLEALLLQEQDRASAEDAFRRADERGHPGAACNLGVLLEQQGDLAGAGEAYRRADARGHAVGAYNLGALLEQQGDLKGAEDAYRRADDRGDAMGAFSLGVLLEWDGDLPGAMDAYRRADERGDAAGACNLGLLLKQEGDRAGALHALQRADTLGSGEIARVAHAALLELTAPEDPQPTPDGQGKPAASEPDPSSRPPERGGSRTR